MTTALILDDIPESRAWLEEAVRGAFAVTEIHQVCCLAEARAWLAGASAPDIALIDLGLPDGSGVELISELNHRFPSTLCIVASIFDDDEHLFPALRAGAKGYLLKDQPQAQIIELLKGVAEGRPPLSPAIARKMIAYFVPHEEPVSASLTERELQVLRNIAKGFTLNETARMLGISPHTVSGYVKEVYRKLNVSSRAEAAVSARNMGLI
jgi:DNA-binding NarL/FixJ family response regulator